MTHIFDLVSHPAKAHIIAVDGDFEALTTKLTTHAVSDEGLRIVHEKTVDGLLRNVYPTPEGLVAATMPVRKWGEPIFIETWSWNFESHTKREIRRPKLGLMNFALDQTRGVMLVDRDFPESGTGASLICDAESLEVRGRVPLDSNLISPVFEPGGDRLALIHTDQGGAEVKLFHVGANETVLLRELGKEQVTLDDQEGSLCFLPGDELLVHTLTTWSAAGELAAYSAATGQQRFSTKLENKAAFEALSNRDERFQDEDGGMLISNTRLCFAVVDGAAYVGGVGGVFRVALSDGAAEHIDVAGVEGVVTRVVACGGRLVVIDHDGALGCI